LELAHKRRFLETFRRWEMLFKRKDTGDVAAEKWLIAEYYKSLGHLSPAGFDALTDCLKEQCTFFPTIRECLDITRPPKYTYASPFYGAPAMFLPAKQLQMITARPAIEHKGESA
jgi:hypothetical protein